MSIVFFDLFCKTNSNNPIFGLCDDTPPPEKPAYIDELSPPEWIGIVHNPYNYNVDFYAIDNCIIILKPDGINKESRCDGMLHYDNSLIFVELKMRGNSGWLIKARTQLTITIEKFMDNNDISTYKKVEAYVCNGLRPLAIQGNNIQLEKFKNETGLNMIAKQEIIL